MAKIIIVMLSFIFCNAGYANEHSSTPQAVITINQSHDQLNSNIEVFQKQLGKNLFEIKIGNNDPILLVTKPPIVKIKHSKDSSPTTITISLQH